MKKRRINFRILLLAALLLSMSACSWESGESLYSLPELPLQYYDLQKQIDQVLATGAESISPASGFNRQAIQLVDLNGDGQQEAVSFLSTQEDQPLRIYIYQLNGSSYSIKTVISEDGEGFDSIFYEDLNDDGQSEIIAGVKVGESAFKAMSVYSIADGKPSLLMSSDYTKYALYDIDGDQSNNLIVIRYDNTTLTGMVDMYKYDEQLQLITLNQSAAMSVGIGEVQRIKTGVLVDGYPAVFIDSGYQDTGLITDVFACRKDGFVNITLDTSVGVSTSTIRQHNISVTDINNDGIMDFPHPFQLAPYDKGDTEDFWIMNWRSYTLSGLEEPVISTYHNFADGWYFVLPEDWVENLTLRRINSAGERAIVFSLFQNNGGPPTDVLTLYTLSGDDRLALAQLEGRFLVTEGPDMAIAAEIGEGAGEYALTQQQVIEGVGLINKDWITG